MHNIHNFISYYLDNGENSGCAAQNDHELNMGQYSPLQSLRPNNSVRSAESPEMDQHGSSVGSTTGKNMPYTKVQ